MRDLSGRRQRDVNNEKKLVKYVEGAAERERLEREKKEAKMEKLRMMAEGEEQQAGEQDDLIVHHQQLGGHQKEDGSL